MKTLINILTFTMLFSSAFGQDANRLYPVKEGGLWGYIDKSGRQIIKPQFYAAGQFQEEIAPVRVKGTYGYIDRTGRLIIPAQYDIAYPFIQGLAKVFIDGKPFFIDRKGNIIFQHNYKSISLFTQNELAIVVSQTGKYGMIDKYGNLRVDTIFQMISPFNDGRAVVWGLNHFPYWEDTAKEEKFEVGVIDTAGKWIVPYGRYKMIGDFRNHYAQVIWMNSNDYAYDALIDEQGNRRFIFRSKKFEFRYDSKGFNSGIAVVSIFPVDIDRVKAGSSRSTYEGAIDLNGKLLFSDTGWVRLTPFVYNHAFARDVTGKWKLIDKLGRQVGDLIFDGILYDPNRNDVEDLFAGGLAYVNYMGSWVAIDTSGKKIQTAPKSFDKIDYDHLYRFGNIIFFKEDISVDHPPYSFCYGFWNTANNVVVPPVYHYIDMRHFSDELISFVQEGLRGYITSDGMQIWKEAKANEPRDTLNIDFMNPGYFYTASKFRDDLAGYGGWGGSRNQSKIADAGVKGSINQLQVIIDPSQKMVWSGRYPGMKLSVTNFSNDTLYFDAQYSRLDLKMQAQDKHGVWKDIECMPSDCFGHHILYLGPDELWEFSIPVYQGALKTKLRAQLLYKTTVEGEKTMNAYSNEIDGYINPGQFWNKKTYYPDGLMDPYID